MFFTLKKIEKRLAELKKKRYRNHRCIAPFAAMKGNLGEDEYYHDIPQSVSGLEFGLNDTFEGRNQYLWLEKTVTVPEKIEGHTVIGLFNFGVTGDGHSDGFESLLYVDGHPYQGVGTYHNEVFFEGEEGKTLRLTFLLWSGLEGWRSQDDPTGIYQFCHCCKQADFAYLHDKTDELYYYTKAILETLKLLDENHEQYEDLKHLLDHALNMIDWDGNDFYVTAEQAHALLMEGLNRLEKHTEVTVHAIGHTHIDVAWLWRLKHTREKAQRSFSTVLRLMERYDEYIFLQTQPQLYKYIKEDCPELYARIKQKIADGKWEPDGGMWVEADCNIPSGESLVRQLLYGTRFMEEEFGKKCEFLWLPDVFGYSWALPQILKQCGIKTFMTTKISWNQYNQIPNDVFLWKGIDGSEILTYFIDVPTYTSSLDVYFSAYNGNMTTDQVMNSWKAFKNKELSKDILMSYGHGDGGGGVSRNMLEMRRALDKVPGLPHVKTGTAGEFFRKLHDKVENTDRYVPVWDGELYLEYHRGTYTSQAYNKKENRQLEYQLNFVEALASMAYVLGGEYPKEDLHDSWETLLLHQFHDIIPGSSIREVYEDSHVNYDKTREQVDRARQNVLNTLMKQEKDAYSIFSVNSHVGKELVTIPESSDGYFTDEQGNQLMAQKTEDGYEVLIETKAYGVVKVKFCPTSAEEVAPLCTSFNVERDRIETPHYKIRWNENNQLVEIYDKDADRQVLKTGQLGNVLEVYEDKPLGGEAWDIELYHLQKRDIVESVGCPELIENGNLRAVIRFNYKYRASTICQDMVVYRDSRRIDFKTVVDWKENRKLLKTSFHTDIRSTEATYDIQFGHTKRPTHWNNSWDWARFEVCGHKWADLSEHGYGVSLLNDCKYGYSVKDNKMSLSLLRSSKWPDYNADMGQHQFTYAILPHMGNLEDGDVIGEANCLNLPAQVLSGVFLDNRQIVRFSKSGVQVDAIKKAEDEDCLIIRMHECRGGREKVQMSSDLPVKRIVPCDLLEYDNGEPVKGQSIVFEIAPFEIRTFKLFL